MELAAFDTASPAVYTLTHTSTAIDRQSYFPPDCIVPAPGSTLTVPLLTKLALPDGSFYTMRYETSTSPAATPAAAESLRLPTGGGFAWTYGKIDFISQDPELNAPDYARSAYSIEKKEIYTSFKADGTPDEKIGEWTYDYVTLAGEGFNPAAQGSGQNAVPCFHTVTVTDPVGNATVNYFDSAPSSISRWQYGLPFRRCNASGQVALASLPVAGGLRGLRGHGHQAALDLRRLRERRPRRRLAPGQEPSSVDCAEWSTTTIPARFKETVFDDFDGLGHYRETTTTGNFAGSDSRAVTTSYNPGSGTLKINPETSTAAAGNTFTMPAVTDPWVLETFNQRHPSPRPATRRPRNSASTPGPASSKGPGPEPVPAVLNSTWSRSSTRKKTEEPAPAAWPASAATAATRAACRPGASVP